MPCSVWMPAVVIEGAFRDAVEANCFTEVGEDGSGWMLAGVIWSGVSRDRPAHAGKFGLIIGEIGHDPIRPAAFCARTFANIDAR